MARHWLTFTDPHRWSAPTWRAAPAFVRNLRGAHHLNIAHALYPRDPTTEAQMANLLAYWRTHVSTSSGRTYAGGLMKSEPREPERIPIPRVEPLDASRLRKGGGFSAPNG